MKVMSSTSNHGPMLVIITKRVMMEPVESTILMNLKTQAKVRRMIVMTSPLTVSKYLSTSQWKVLMVILLKSHHSHKIR